MRGGERARENDELVKQTEAEENQWGPVRFDF